MTVSQARHAARNRRARYREDARPRVRARTLPDLASRAFPPSISPRNSRLLSDGHVSPCYPTTDKTVSEKLQRTVFLCRELARFVRTRRALHMPRAHWIRRVFLWKKLRLPPSLPFPPLITRSDGPSHRNTSLFQSCSVKSKRKEKKGSGK